MSIHEAELTCALCPLIALSGFPTEVLNVRFRDKTDVAFGGRCVR